MKDRDYSKTEVALYQLEKAIELYIEGNDYISCITLAGASEEITGRMVQRNGQKHFLERLKEYYKNNPEVDTSDKFYNWARQTRNALKHFNNENETHVYVTISYLNISYLYLHVFLRYSIIRVNTYWKLLLPPNLHKIG